MPAVSSDVLPILNKLSGANADDRAWAASAICNLILDPDTRQQLLQGGVIPALFLLLSDDKYQIQMEATAALRNLAIVGGDEICRILLQNNIMQLLVSIIPKLMHPLDIILSCSNGSPQIESSNDQMDLTSLFHFSEQVIALAWSLIELSQFALDESVAMIPFMMKLLSKASEAPLSTRKVTAQCLMAITEDNHDSFKYIEINILLQIIQDDVEALSLRVITCGILMHLKQHHELIINTIKTLLSKNWSDYIAQSNLYALAIKTDLPIVEDQAVDILDLKNSDKNYVALSEMEETCRNIQVALEIFSNLCVLDDSNQADQEWEDSDCENDTEADDLHDEQMHDAYDITDLSETISWTQALLDSNLLHICVNLALQQTNSDHENLSTFNKEWYIVRIRALGALNNIFTTLGKDWANNNQQILVSVWNNLFSIGSAANDELLSILLESIWSLSRIMPISIIQPTDDQINGLVNLYNRNCDFQISCVGILGYIAQSKGYVSFNGKIGEFFMNQLQITDSIEVINEILNSMFDIYADKGFDYDFIFINNGFLDRLQKMVPVLKQKQKSASKSTMIQVKAMMRETMKRKSAIGRQIVINPG